MVRIDKPALFVVGIDGSEASVAALRWTLREAAASGATVDVVHSWRPQSIMDAVLTSPADLHIGSMSMLANEVTAAMVGIPNPPEVTQTSLRGGAAPVLLNRAAHAQLLVLGAHGQTSLGDRVFGKVATTCLREARCEVAIVDRTEKVVRNRVGEQVKASA